MRQYDVTLAYHGGPGVTESHHELVRAYSASGAHIAAVEQFNERRYQSAHKCGLLAFDIDINVIKVEVAS